jgi:thiosulfate reductase/polysulfide reductase chain A
MRETQHSSSRAKVYKTLSYCFCYPDQTFFIDAKENLPKIIDYCVRELPYKGKLRDTYKHLRSALLNELTMHPLEEIQTEYTGLFVYYPGTHSCYPYESIYIDKGKLLMGNSTMAVKRLYRDFHLEVSPHFSDLPDHIAAELEFMHFLSFNEAKFAAIGMNQYRDFCLRKEMTFLEEHMLRWVPEFSERIKAESSLHLFKSLAQFTCDYIALEAKYLASKKRNYRQVTDFIKETESFNFDSSTLSVLEHAEAPGKSEVKWVYTTTAERAWHSPVKVKVVDGRVEQIVARDGVPFFDGQQVTRSFACVSQLYARDKLKFPLKRVGKRGDGKFKRISWNEALNEIATVLKKYRDEGNARYVAFLRTHPPLEFMFHHFPQHYGTPNDVHTSTTSCYADGHIAKVQTAGYGNLDDPDGDLGRDDYMNAKYCIYIGHNLLCGLHETPGSQPHGYAMFAEAIRKGMKFVFVDPRLNEGAYTYGAEWVPIKPGTDAAFILGLMNVIIRDGLYDEDFLISYTNAPILVKPDRHPLKNQSGEYLVWDEPSGRIQPLAAATKPALWGCHQMDLDTYQGDCKTAFQLLAERVKAYTPEKAAEITTIGKERIEEIARDLGKLKPEVCIYTKHNVSSQYTNSMQYCRARNVLMCLLGVFDQPGGKYYGPYGPTGITLNNSKNFRIPLEIPPMTDDRVDFSPDVHPCLNIKTPLFPNGITQHVLRAIRTGKPYPIKALFIIGSDVLASQSSEWRQAFNKVEFIVKSHVWPDDDVDYADIVLPETSFLERDDGFTQITVRDPKNQDTDFSFLSVIQKVVEPQFEERPWTDYVKELAQKIGFGEYYDFSLDEFWDFLLEPMGIDINYLREHGVHYPTPLVTRKVEFGKKEKWETDTGRLNIYSCEMADLWHKNRKNILYDPLPIYYPVSVEPRAEDEFYFISGKCSYFWCNYYRNNALLLERYLEGELANTRLWINTGRATALGIKDGDWVWLESKATAKKEKIRVKLTEGIHPCAVWHVYGYGHKSRLMDKSSKAREGVNVQDFVPEHSVPWTAGQAHCEAVVKVYKRHKDSHDG